MGLFGKSFEEQVKAAIDQINAKGLGVTGLQGKVEGKTVTLTGEASSPAAKGQVMHEFNTLVETENTMNNIRVAHTAPMTTPAAPVSSTATTAPMTSTTKPMSGVSGGGSTTAPAATAKPAETFHVVAKGDTLSAIAKKYYGNASQYMKIFDANKDQLKDPDKIQPGQKLRIPGAGTDHIA